jgi:hypothetical protein
MRFLAALVLSLFSTYAFAQVPEKTYALTLSASEVKLVVDVLSERPYKEVAVVMFELSRQIGAQAALPPVLEPIVQPKIAKPPKKARKAPQVTKR